MSFVDLEKLITSEDPNFFKIGDVVLTISVDNIQVSRHENYQTVSYLRDMHAMKIHTGRSTLRVNISFPILVDKDLTQLQSLVAMTRVTPFVPVQNRFLQGQLKIYDTSPTVFEMNKTPDSKAIAKIQKTLTGNAYTSKNEPTFLEALPMAIMGISITMGGDSPELAECSMSLLFWNPMPWFGVDLQYWKEESLLGLKRDYNRYIRSKIHSRSPSSFDSTVFRWWDIKLYGELNERFAKEIAEAIKNAPGPGTPQQTQIEEELVRSNADNQINFSDFNNYLKFASKHTTVDQLLEGIAAVETDSYGKNSGWSETNDNTWTAGRYQMSAETYRGLVFEGNDVPGGIPLKDRFTEELAGSPSLKDSQLRTQMRGGGMTAPGKSLNKKDKEQWAKWYARPQMAELQTFVSTEFLKGLYKKHDNDAVKASLEYFLGATDALPYIKHWETHHTMKDWEKGDVKKLGTDNKSPIVYMKKVFGSMGSSNSGYTYDNSIQAADSQGLNLDGSGPIPRNRKGDLLGAGIEPVIPTVVHDKLRELGWEQIALLEDGRPNPNIINPLFTRIEANIIDLESGGILDAENQVVTSITISFQNRFASLPVQGWPYPALQHMGSIDSEIRMTISCLSDSQQYNRLQQAQSMLHIMASRARRYHSDVHDAREILQLSRLACDNRLINQLGINDVVMTDLSVQIDPESPNLARGEIVMSESAFDPNKEKLVASLGKNDRRFRIGLRESWLANERYLESPNSSVVNMGVRLRALQKANDKALASNYDLLFESGQLDRVIAQSFNDDAEFRDMVIFSREDQEYYRKQEQEITEFTDFSTKRGLKLEAAKYVSPTARVLNTWEIIPVSEFEKIYKVVVPVNPDLLLTESLGTKIGDFLKSLYDSDQSATGDPNEIERIKGDAATFLSTSFGFDLLQVWGRLKDQPTAETFHRDMGRFFHLLTKALHEWYNTEIIELMLILLYRRNEADPTFKSVVAQSRDIPGAGIYKDLLLDRDPLTNPYEWLDAAIEPKILSAMDDAVRAAEQNTDVLIKEFKNFLRDDDANVRFHRNSSSSKAVAKDTSRSSQKDANEGARRYQTGLQSTLDRVGVDAHNAALSLRDFSAVNFTMRRAFPAYRMYFIEEDNQGIIKRFDDFYNYNAITDIQMIKYKNRPTTMIVTMTNLFGHLDAKTFSDMSDKEELAEAIRANAAGGTLVTQSFEESGSNYQVEADGTVSPLREIMLKPGTKIVMKLGYDNNPDNLPTVFAGQITEITGGAVMTIVCQDWMSELLAGVGPEDGIPTEEGSIFSIAGAINLFKYGLNTSETRDLQNTASVRGIVQGVLTQRNVAHFGHWQLDKTQRDPNYFGYRKQSSLILKAFNAEDIFGDLLKFFGNDQIEGKSRAFINIHPVPMPFYNAFGTDIGSSLPRPEEVHSMTLWEMIEMQRRLMPNHIALVRPYGQGDATLYFGPPWGVYVAAEFDGEVDIKLSDSILNIHNREVFRNMIQTNVTILVSGYTRFNETFKERLRRDFGNLVGIHGKDGIVEMPIGVVLELFKEIIAKEADTNIVGTLNSVARAAGAINPLAGVVGRVIINQLDIQEEKTDFNVLPFLHSNTSPAVIDKWYDLLLNIQTRGGFREDSDASSVLINIMDKIARTQQAVAWQRSRDEEGFDPSGSIRKALKPVRRWHIATAKHHIIANNIQLNNNFANEVTAGGDSVRYDTELTDRRTRFADQEMPKSVRDTEPDKSLYMTSLLAEEVRTMYRGQLVLTGNAEIEPHDIIMIFDQTRHMHGAIEVAKVTHIFNQEMGFISIVEPHLIVEQADYSLSTAIAAFLTALVGDVKENEETITGKVVNRAVGGGFAVAGALTYLTTGPVTTGLAVNYIFTQLLVKSDAKNHPLTIYPLVKRMVPWIAGIEGASGRGVIGILGHKIIKGLKTVRKAVTELSDRVGDINESAKVIPGALNITGAQGTSSDNPRLGKHK